MKATRVVPRAPHTTVEVPVLIETGLSRSQRSVRAGSSSASSEATAQAIGPPLVSTTAVPRAGSDATSRSNAAPTRVVKAANDSS